MIAKAVISGISIILVVGVVIGVVTTIHKNGEDKPTAQMKAVSQFCEPTEYKDVCLNSLNSVNSSDPKELIKAAMVSISNSMNQTFKLSQELVDQAKKGTREKIALEDCKQMLNNSVERFKEMYQNISDSDMKALSDNSYDFRIWLSNIISYNEMCMDGFEDDSPARTNMRNSTEFGNILTDNVLNVLGALDKVLDSFGIKLNSSSTQRRLLQADGYPSWIPAHDRKLLAANNNPKPNAVVASDGSGQYKSIQAAVNAYPKNSKGRFVIYVKGGTYKEYVTISKEKKNIYMYGDGSRKTIITGHKSYKDGIGTWKTATFVVEADGFICKNMGFSNTAGPQGHQAVAIRVLSDPAAFHSVRFDGYQDTLLYQGGKQFYRNCIISGTQDFIFGYGTAVIQNSLIIVRRPLDGQSCTVTADGKKMKGEVGGVVIHNCRIVPEAKLVPDRLKIKTYLGRPWKDYSTTVVMETELGDFIQPAGWLAWSGNLYLNTLYYAEYANRGPGANKRGRVKWSTLHFLRKQDALRFTAAAFIQANKWVPDTQIPFIAGLRR